MTKIISFSGISNSGKTTLINGLCKLLVPYFKVGVIKHDPKNKAVFDVEGKDSYKFFQSGANVAIVSPLQTTIRFHNEITNDEILSIFNQKNQLDYLFIEGFKTMPYRKICVVRGEFNSYDVANADAIATLNANNEAFSGKIVLDLNNHNKILEWINNG